MEDKKMVFKKGMSYIKTTRSKEDSNFIFWTIFLGIMLMLIGMTSKATTGEDFNQDSRILTPFGGNICLIIGGAVLIVGILALLATRNKLVIPFDNQKELDEHIGNNKDNSSCGSPRRQREELLIKKLDEINTKLNIKSKGGNKK